jgi:hypothetical protein
MPSRTHGLALGLQFLLVRYLSDFSSPGRKGEIKAEFYLGAGRNRGHVGFVFMRGWLVSTPGFHFRYQK